MSGFLTLTLVAVPFVITPGASFTLTLVHAGPRHTGGWSRIALGTGAGILLLALGIGATGLGSALHTTPPVRVILGLVGATVLLTFGTMTLVDARRRTADRTTTPRSASLVRWSFAALVTNPKPWTLYATIVPTLAAPGLDGPALFVSFAIIHIGLLTGWLFLVHHAATRIPGVARSSRIQRVLVTVAGITMVLLGLATGVRSVVAA